MNSSSLSTTHTLPAAFLHQAATHVQDNEEQDIYAKLQVADSARIMYGSSGGEH